MCMQMPGSRLWISPPIESKLEHRQLFNQRIESRTLEDGGARLAQKAEPLPFHKHLEAPSADDIVVVKSPSCSVDERVGHIGVNAIDGPSATYIE